MLMELRAVRQCVKGRGLYCMAALKGKDQESDKAEKVPVRHSQKILPKDCSDAPYSSSAC